MSSIINTNSLSLLTQNNLTKSQSSMNTAIQRLSSGMRINSAKDDAAGQAIANRFTANIKGLTQAQRNANDGISLAQTTEGALNEINTNLQRIRELSVQAANGSNSSADKVSIQSEITQRMAEIDRTSAQTDFNGTKVLASAQNLTIQVGANDGQTIAIGLQQIDSGTLGLAGFSVASNALPVSAAITQIPGAAAAAPAAVNLDAAVTTINSANGTTLTAADMSLRNVLDRNGAATTNYVVKSGNDYYAANVTPGGVVSLNTTSTTWTDPENGINTAVVASTVPVKVGVDALGATTGYVTFQGKNFVAAAAALTNTGGAASDTATTAIVISGASKTTQFAGAASSKQLETIDAALKKVDTLRGSLGAVQNRFDSVISNLATTVTNLSASRSRIEDADYAVEVSNMTRAQILQQAGTSVLAKANQSTQGVLSLLQ
jgi:flagellin